MARNRFTLFTHPKPSTPYHELIKTLDDFIREFRGEHRKYLLAKMRTEVLANPTLLTFSNNRKRFTSENYLNQFITTFAEHPNFSTTVLWFRNLLEVYQTAKKRAREYSVYPTTNAEESAQKLAHQVAQQLPNEPFFKSWRHRLNSLRPLSLPTTAQKTEIEQILTPQQQAWQQLTQTLKRCVNNETTRQLLAWHPHRLEYYYLAKLRLQWELYQSTYENIETNSLSQRIAHDIGQERQEIIVKIFLEEQQALMEDKNIQFKLTRLAKEQKKISEEQHKAIENIQSLVPQFERQSAVVIEFAASAPNHTILHAFNKAILEAKRQNHPINTRNHLSLFGHSNHYSRETQAALATLEPSDSAKKRKTYLSLIIAEHDKMSNSLDNITPTPAL